MKEIISWLQRALNPAGLERWIKKQGLSGLPVGEAASLYAAQLIKEKYGFNFPGGTEILAAYIRNDYKNFIKGDPEEIATNILKKRRCINLFGANICWGEDVLNWKTLGAVVLVGFLAYKFLRH